MELSVRIVKLSNSYSPSLDRHKLLSSLVNFRRLTFMSVSGYYNLKQNVNTQLTVQGCVTLDTERFLLTAFSLIPVFYKDVICSFLIFSFSFFTFLFLYLSSFSISAYSCNKKFPQEDLIGKMIVFTFSFGFTVEIWWIIFHSTGQTLPLISVF